jgi:hypothetical protein
MGFADVGVVLLADQGFMCDAVGDGPLVRFRAADMLGEVEGEVVLVDEFVAGVRGW